MKEPLPSLAKEEPTRKLTKRINANGKQVHTVASLVNLIQEGIAHATDADIERIITLGRIAQQERRERRKSRKLKLHTRVRKVNKTPLFDINKMEGALPMWGEGTNVQLVV